MTPAFPAEITRDTEDHHGGVDLGDLPDWDLTDLYPAMDAPEVEADLAKTAAACQAFAQAYEGNLADLDGDGLAGALADYENVDRVLGRIMSFAGLLYQQNTQDMDRAKFLGDMQGRITDLTQPLVFFTLELNRLDKDHLDTRVGESAALARYRPWLDRVRAMQPYQLGIIYDSAQKGLTP